jgi:hypothetical protein
MVTPAAKREAVAHLRTLFEVSERRACKVLEADRTSVRYRGQRADDATVRTPYGQKIETAQRRQRSNIFGLGPVLHNKLAVDA